MIYQYANEDKSEIIEREFPMSGNIPSTIEENGKIYKRLWTQNFIIPYVFTHPFKFNYDQSPSGRKHFY